MQYKNIDILFSTDCNMACQYCYIKKNKKEMFEYNKKTQEYLENGRFIENLKNNLDEFHYKEVEHIGLWGAEPTLNAKYFHNLLNNLLETFPNLNGIMFSTNSFLGYQYVKYFIDAVNELTQKYNKPNFELEIQFSLDGPPEVNDKSRRLGATQRTIDTIYQIYDNFKDEDFFCRLHITLKPTLAIKYMKKMIEEPAEITIFSNFFKEISDNIKEKVKGNKKINNELPAYLTIVLPGEYTSEDGKTYAKWVNLLRKYKDINFSHIQPFRAFNKIEETQEGYKYNAPICCGAGFYSMVFNCDGNRVSCHQLGQYSCYPKEKLSSPFIQSHTTLTGESSTKVEYTANLLHIYEPEFYNYFEILTIQLAKSGQIEPIYLENHQARRLLFLFATCAFCYASQGEETQEPFFFAPSLIRFFGNGAMEILLLYGKEKGLLKYDI